MLPFFEDFSVVTIPLGIVVKTILAIHLFQFKYRRQTTLVTSQVGDNNTIVPLTFNMM